MDRMSSKGRCESSEESTTAIGGGDQQKHKDYRFNVMIIGVRRVGKTDLLEALGAKDVEGQPYKEMIVKDIETGCPVTLCLYESDENELFAKAHCVVCVADITKSDGCDIYLRNYWQVKSHNRCRIPYVAIGNKSDLSEIRAWSSKQARKDCDCGDIPYIETSAKMNKNVTEAFRIVTDATIQWAKKFHITYETGDPYKDPAQGLNREDELEDEKLEGGGCCVVS